MTIYVKSLDTTNLTIGEVGLTLSAGEEREVSPVDYLLWAISVNGGDTETAIDDDKLIVKNGTNQLTKDGSKKVLGFLSGSVYTSSTDKNPDYLINKIHAGTNITVEEYDAGSGNKKAKINSTGSGGGISEYNYASSESLSSTTSTNYQNKVSLSVDVPAGNYRIGWSYEWRVSNQNFPINTRVQLDNSTDLSRVELSSFLFNRTNQTSGFKSDIALDGEHTIDIDYKASHFTKAVYIGRARLELWRVS